MSFKKRNFVYIIFLFPLLTRCFFVGKVFALSDTSNPVDHIVISEIQIGGVTSNDEFIELYNPTSLQKDISSYSLQYQAEGGTVFYKKNFEEGTLLSSYGFFLVAHNEFEGGREPDMRHSSFSMASQGKIFFVKNQDKLNGEDFSLVEDEVAWSDLGVSQSFERKAESSSTAESMMAGGDHEFSGNGFDTNTFEADFVVRTSPEPQNRLSPIEPISLIEDTSEESDSSSEGPREESEEELDEELNGNIEENEASAQVEETLEKTSNSAQGMIVLNEIFPNPENEDDEFIELQNIGERSIDILGWKITDGTYEYVIGSTDFSLTLLDPQRYFLLPRSVTGLSLNNSGESVLLFDASGTLESVLEYLSAPEGKSYSRYEDSWWEWTNHVSPGEENIFESPNEAPMAKLQIEGSFLTEDSLLFSAQDSIDPEGGTLWYSWQWNDDTSAEGSRVSKIFYETGNFKVHLVVYDSLGAKDEITYEFEVEENPEKVTSSTEDITIQNTNTSQSSSSQNASFSGVISDTSIVETRNVSTNFSKNILITALLPNPVGKDEDEWIELYNKEAFDVDLSGWQIDDQEGGSSRYTFPENFLFGGGKYLVLHSDLTHIILNNNEDEVRLFHPDGNILLRLFYKEAREGEVLFYQNGEYIWEAEGENNSEVFAAFEARHEEITSEEQKDGTVKENVQEEMLPEEGENFFASSSKENISIEVISLSSAKQQTLGSLVRVQGMVTILPGMLGSQYFYIADENDGIQVYMYKKDFPELSLGDFVEAEGVLSESRGEKRIKVTKREDIHVGIARNGDSIFPQTVDWLDDSLVGKFVQLQGEIFERTKKYLTLSFGEHEIRADLRILQPESLSLLPSENALVKIQGIIMKKKDKYEIFPRNMDDVQILSTPYLKKEEDKKRTLISKTPYDKKYFFFLFIMSLSIVMLSVFLWVLRRRAGSLVKKEKIGYDNTYL